MSLSRGALGHGCLGMIRRISGRVRIHGMVRLHDWMVLTWYWYSCTHGLAAEGAKPHIKE